MPCMKHFHSTGTNIIHLFMEISLQCVCLEDTMFSLRIQTLVMSISPPAGDKPTHRPNLTFNLSHMAYTYHTKPDLTKKPYSYSQLSVFLGCFHGCLFLAVFLALSEASKLCRVAIFYEVCFCFDKLLRLSLYIMLVLMRWREGKGRTDVKSWGIKKKHEKRRERTSKKGKKREKKFEKSLINI